jgi:hypothetical protein
MKNIVTKIIIISLLILFLLSMFALVIHEFIPKFGWLEINPDNMMGIFVLLFLSGLGLGISLAFASDAKII